VLFCTSPFLDRDSWVVDVPYHRYIIRAGAVEPGSEEELENNESSIIYTGIIIGIIILVSFLDFSRKWAFRSLEDEEI